MPPVAGVGAKLRRWSGTAFVDIAGIRRITGPGMSRETIDTTALDTAGGYRTFISGFRNPGTMTLEVLFTRETYDKLRADFDSDVAQNYELLIPDAENTSIDFEGLVTELPLDIPPDDAIVMNVTIQISGEAASGSGSGPSPGA